MQGRLLAALTSSALALALTASAFANPTIGGHKETFEAFDLTWGSNWAGPGVDPTPGAAVHVLLSEVCVTPTGSEFIEISNPTGAAVDLSNFCLSDHWRIGSRDVNGYFRRPDPGYSLPEAIKEFNVCFPAGTVIAPGGVLTIAASATGFLVVYQFPPDFEILGDSGDVPDMVDVGGNRLGLPADLLPDDSKFVVLYYWDGVSDLVCDVDYFGWGDSPGEAERVDKTGLSVDGPDPDGLASTYNPDLGYGAQWGLASHNVGESFQRALHNEVGEATTGGNGCIELATPARRTTWGNVKQIYR